MADALLDYFFKVSLNVAPANASTGYLHKALAIVKAAENATKNVITQISSQSELATYTADTSAAAWFNAGGGSLYVLPVDTLSDAASVVSEWSDGFTVLIGNGFSESDALNFDVGNFKGVVAANFASQQNAKMFGGVENRCGYNGDIVNMFYAFGALLGDTEWKNQQALSLPTTDGVTTAALAESKFDDRVSFGLTSDQYGTRLAFLVCGGIAIVAPYVIEEIKIRLQSRWLQYAAVNNPGYTVTDAKLVQQDLQTAVLDKYIEQNLIDSGSVEIALADDDFVANANIAFPRPRAWWRILATLTAN